MIVIFLDIILIGILLGIVIVLDVDVGDVIMVIMMLLSIVFVFDFFFCMNCFYVCKYMYIDYN